MERGGREVRTCDGGSATWTACSEWRVAGPPPAVATTRADTRARNNTPPAIQVTYYRVVTNHDSVMREREPIVSFGAPLPTVLLVHGQEP